MQHKILISLALASATIVGGIIGGGINDIQRNQAAESSWDGVLVVSKGGTLVANPSALTPKELASYTIINPMDHMTICTDRSGRTFVNPTDDECQDFKSIRHL